MKTGIYILRFSIPVLLACLVLFIDLFYWDGDSLEPLGIDFFVTLLIAALGIYLSLLLSRRAHQMRPAFFWIWLILYLLLFTFPALVGCYYMYTFLTL